MLHDSMLHGRPLHVREDREDGSQSARRDRDAPVFSAGLQRGGGGGGGRGRCFVSNLAWQVCLLLK